MKVNSTLFGVDDGLRPGLDFHVGERVRYESSGLGVCAGVIVGVWPLGLTVRRDGVAWPSRPASLRYSQVLRLSRLAPLSSAKCRIVLPGRCAFDPRARRAAQYLSTPMGQRMYRLTAGRHLREAEQNEKRRRSG